MSCPRCPIEQLGFFPFTLPTTVGPKIVVSEAAGSVPQAGPTTTNDSDFGTARRGSTGSYSVDIFDHALNEEAAGLIAEAV